MSPGEHGSKQALQDSRRHGLALVAVGLGGFVVHSGMLNASQRQNRKHDRRPAIWIGQKVVTKYSVPSRLTIKFLDRRRKHIDLYREGSRRRTGQARFQRRSGWIEASKIILIDQAVEFYSKELLANPNNADAYFERGMIWRFVGKKDEAISDFTEAIRLVPSNAFAYERRPLLFDEQKKFDKAIADYTEAIRLNPQT